MDTEGKEIHLAGVCSAAWTESRCCRAETSMQRGKLGLALPLPLGSCRVLPGTWLCYLTSPPSHSSQTCVWPCVCMCASTCKWVWVHECVCTHAQGCRCVYVYSIFPPDRFANSLRNDLLEWILRMTTNFLTEERGLSAAESLATKSLGGSLGQLTPSGSYYTGNDHHSCMAKFLKVDPLFLGEKTNRKPFFSTSHSSRRTSYDSIYT